jgi:hypothetical protein
LVFRVVHRKRLALPKELLVALSRASRQTLATRARDFVSCFSCCFATECRSMFLIDASVSLSGPRLRCMCSGSIRVGTRVGTPAFSSSKVDNSVDPGN